MWVGLRSAWLSSYVARFGHQIFEEISAAWLALKQTVMVALHAVLPVEEPAMINSARGTLATTSAVVQFVGKFSRQ